MGNYFGKYFGNTPGGGGPTPPSPPTVTREQSAFAQTFVDFALDSLLNYHGVDAAYAAAAGAAVALACRVIASPISTELFEEPGSRITHYQRHVQIPLTIAAAPVHGDRIDLGDGDVWTVDRLIAIDAGLATVLATQPVKSESGGRRHSTL